MHYTTLYCTSFIWIAIEVFEVSLLLVMVTHALLAEIKLSEGGGVVAKSFFSSTFFVRIIYCLLASISMSPKVRIFPHAFYSSHTVVREVSADTLLYC